MKVDCKCCDGNGVVNCRKCNGTGRVEGDFGDVKISREDPRYDEFCALKVDLEHVKKQAARLIYLKPEREQSYIMMLEACVEILDSQAKQLLKRTK